MLTGEGRLTCVISSRRRMSQTLTAVSSSCRAWRKIDSFLLLLAHDNLFSYDHSITSYCSLNYLPQQRSVRHGTYGANLSARGHVNLRQKYTASFQIAYPAYLSLWQGASNKCSGSTLATLSDVDCDNSSLISAVEPRRGCTAAGGFLKFADCHLATSSV